MKTITCSNRIYYSELSSEEANALHQDIQLYHAMMHTAYHLFRFLNRREWKIVIGMKAALHFFFQTVFKGKGNPLRLQT